MEDRYLFKAKRLDTDGWVIGNRVDSPDGRVAISETSGEWGLCECIPSTICQCTGLKDKNGKLIWENDIVDGHIKRGVAFLNCLVLWNECKARFDVRVKGCNFPFVLGGVAGDMVIGGLDYEVVGNRFDNPELLEE